MIMPIQATLVGWYLAKLSKDATTMTTYHIITTYGTDMIIKVTSAPVYYIYVILLVLVVKVCTVYRQIRCQSLGSLLCLASVDAT